MTLRCMMSFRNYINAETQAITNYDQITDVFYGGKTELIQKPKSDDR